MIDPELLPWSESAEQSVLGALLLDNEAWDRVADILEVRSFFAHKHGAIYAAIGMLVNACKVADVITVFERLRDAGKDEDVGGLKYLNQLAQSVPSAANARRHAEIIAERYTDRALRQTADEALAIALGKGEAQQRLSAIIASFDKLERRAVRSMPIGLETVMVRRLDALTDMATRGDEPQCWSTGFEELDTVLLGGLYPGRVYLVAGRPSVGKSAWAHWVALNAAIEQGAVCEYLSQEMPADELGDRSLAMVGRIEYERIQLGRLDNDDWRDLSNAFDTCSKAPFMVDDQPALRSNDIRVKARFVKGLNILVIDYVQLCQGAEEGEPNRNAELEVISRAIKTLAKTMNVAVLVLSQLARRVEERANKRAIPSDLKDCGGLEQDADVILSLFPIQLNRGDGYSLIGCDVLKNRQGRKGQSIALEFHEHRLGWKQSQYKVAELLKPTATERRGSAKEL